MQEIAEKTGESMESLYDRISKGTMSVDEITDAMVRSTSEGGKYYKSMEKQSKTLQGQWSTLKDTFAETSAEITSGLAEWATNKGLPKAIELTEKLGDNYQALIPTIAGVTAAAVAMKLAINFDNIVGGLKSTAAFFGTTTGAIGLTVSACAALAGILGTVYEEVNKPSLGFQLWAEKIDAVSEKTENLNAQMGLSTQQWETTTGTLMATTEVAQGYIDRLAELEQKETLTNEEQNEWNMLLETLMATIPGVSSLIDTQTGKIQGGTDALREYIDQWMKTQAAQALSEHMTQAMKEQSTAAANLREATRLYTEASHENARVQNDVNSVLQQAREKFGIVADSTEDAYYQLMSFTSEDLAAEQAARDLAASALHLASTEREAEQTLYNAAVAVDEAREASERADTKVQNLESAFQDLSTGAAEAADVMKRDFSSMANSGSNAMDGVISGMESRRGSLVSKAKSLAAAVKNAFNVKLDIRSPSRVMAESGEYVVDGVIKGIEDETPALERAMQNVADVSASLGSINAAGGTVTNDSRSYGGISVNVYGAAGQDVQELASIVMDEIQAATLRREAALG